MRGFVRGLLLVGGHGARPHGPPLNRGPDRATPYAKAPRIEAPIGGCGGCGRESPSIWDEFGEGAAPPQKFFDF